MSTAGIGRVHSTGMTYEAEPNLDRIPEFDARSGNHYWIGLVSFHVDPSSWSHGEQQHFDMENLVSVAGPGCYYCEQPYSDRIAKRRCGGEPRA
jgi:hypothetical protein